MRAPRQSFAKAALGVAGVATFGASGCGDASPSALSSTSAARTTIPVQRERPPSVSGIGAFVDLAALHAVLKDHHDTGLISGRTWPSTAIALLGLPLLFAQHVDDAAPVRVLLIEGGALLFAIPLRNADLALATATSGSTAQWKRELVGSVDVLRRLDGARTGLSEALGVCRNALLVSTDPVLFERAGDLARYAATPEAEGFAALAEKPTPPRFGALVRGSAIRDLVIAAAGRLPPTFARGALALWSFAFGSYEASEIPIGFTVDPAAATLDISLPDHAEHLGLSPISASSLFTLPASTLAAAYGDRRGGSVDLALLRLLGSSFDPAVLTTLVGATERRALAPVTFTMSRAPTGLAFVLRVEITKAERAIEALDRVSAEPKTEAGPEVQKPAAAALHVEKFVLARIGEVYKIGVGELACAVAVRGAIATIASGEDPVAALVSALESSPASVADRLPRSLATRLPDPALAVLTVDLDVYAPPSERARKVGPGALMVCVFENEGRAILRANLSAAGWRVLRQ